MLSLYERVGGEAAIFAAAQTLYERILADPLLVPFFESTNMEVQTRKMVGFLSRAFGGPAEFHGRDLRTAHASAVSNGMTHAHFDATLAHLHATLVGLQVPDDVVQEVAAVVESMRPDVLGLPRG